MLDRIKEGKSFAGRFFIYAIFIIMTFYLNNGYFNALESKALGVMALFVVFNVACTVMTLIVFIKTPVKDYMKEFFDGFTVMDHAILLFGLALIISNLISNHMKEAFYGTYAWLIGTLFLILSIIAYFYLSRNIKFDSTLVYVILAVIFLESIMIILNYFYVDPFSFHEYLAEKDIPRYIGTIGNVNWYVGFFALTMPIVFACSLVINYLPVKIMSTVLLVLSYYTALISNSDGVFLPLALICAGFIFVGAEKRKLLTGVFSRLTVIFASTAIFEVLSIFIKHTELTGYANPLIYKHIYVVIAVVFMVLTLFTGMLNDDIYKASIKWIRIALIALSLIAAIVVAVQQFSNFSESYGHGRGKIWIAAFSEFKGFNPINKIFGTGASTFGYYYTEYTGSTWVRNAHNEYVEYLITTGIFGLITVLTGLTGVAIEFFKGIKKSNGTMPYVINATTGITIFAYAIQAFVNNPQGLNVGILIVILAIFKWSCFTINSEVKAREIKDLNAQ